jgi:hypothetical protein
MMASGLSSRVIEQFGPIFARTASSRCKRAECGSAPANLPDAKLEPALCSRFPLLSATSRLTAVGTCTEVIGDRVYGFGHPFNNEGPITPADGSGQIHADHSEPRDELQAWLARRRSRGTL